MATLDWIVIAAYFLGLLGLAWWVILKSKDTADDYFLAGRNLGWWVIGASIFASNIGSEHLVGLAGSGASWPGGGRWRCWATTTWPPRTATCTIPRRGAGRSS